MMERPAWMDQDGPPNYVAGIGRGATGFTTRSDIGPARAAAMTPDPAQLAILARKANGEEDEDNQDYSEAQYDQFEGYGGSFMAPNSIYDSEDKEADDIWESIDKKMDEKRKIRREEKMKEEMKRMLQERPTISSQFADLKNELSKVDYSEWDSIPEIGDTTQRYKKKAKTEGRIMPAPDSLLDRARQSSQISTTVEVDGTKSERGTDTPISNDILGVGQGKKQLLEINIKKVAASVSGQANVDAEGFLTSLSTSTKTLTGTPEERSMARKFFASARQTNPQNAPAWIGAARHEMEQGLVSQARKIILEACEACPNSQDVWLEAVSLHPAETGKVILAKAIQHLPKSVSLWIEAAELESDLSAKRKVLRKALEVNPLSEKLWKAAISLEESEDAKILLARAVECLPKSVDMWIALQHLETVEKARTVLNKARLAIPTDFSIWIAASELEEMRGNNPSKPEIIIPKAMKSLINNGVIIDREQWIKEAENSEKKGAVMTCKAIIRQVIDLNIEPEDRKRVWVEDAEACLARSSIETARAIFEHAVTVFPGKKSLWRKLADLEKKYGTKESIESVLKKATTYCPKAEVLWLMYAKEHWLNNDIQGARDVLANAFNYNPNSEQIWLAAVKLEKENNEPGRARIILSKARENNGEKVWRRSVQLERELGNKDEERQLLEECLKKYPQSPKFWIMKGELEERVGDMNAARETYQRGLKNCPIFVPLWICASKLEERTSVSRARSLLEKARVKNPKNEELWLESVRVEKRDNNFKAVQTTLAKAFQECPSSGILWAESIELENPSQKRHKITDALKKCDNNPHVIIAGAKHLWSERKFTSARVWLDRAVNTDPQLGDAWAYLYKLESKHGSEESQKSVISRCVAASPNRGEKWRSVSKNPENFRLKTADILKLVSSQLPNPTDQ